MSNNTNRGFIPVVILIILAIAIFVALYFFFKPTQTQLSTLQPSPSTTSTLPVEESKQEFYEQNRDTIKSDLKMTDQEFETLKRYSAD